jgi:hypothetical protein
MNRNLDAACARRVLQYLKMWRAGCLRIGEDRHATKFGDGFDQDLLSFAV